jgi:hypothetical protein
MPHSLSSTLICTKESQIGGWSSAHLYLPRLYYLAKDGLIYISSATRWHAPILHSAAPINLSENYNHESLDTSIHFL